MKRRSTVPHFTEPLQLLNPLHNKLLYFPHLIYRTVHIGGNLPEYSGSDDADPAVADAIQFAHLHSCLSIQEPDNHIFIPVAFPPVPFFFSRHLFPLLNMPMMAFDHDFHGGLQRYPMRDVRYGPSTVYLIP